jgi:hypothetical protein
MDPYEFDAQLRSSQRYFDHMEDRIKAKKVLKRAARKTAPNHYSSVAVHGIQKLTTPKKSLTRSKSSTNPNK